MTMVRRASDASPHALDLPQAACIVPSRRLIAETATHAGHLDAVRELIDGQTWLILT